MPEWVFGYELVRAMKKKAALFTGQFGQIYGVAFCRSADWMERLFKETSKWDRGRHYNQLIEQYQGMEIEAGRNPDSLVNG
jgi:hypothetical protein